MSSTYRTYIAPAPSAPPILQENMYTSYPQTYQTVPTYYPQTICTPSHHGFNNYKQNHHDICHDHHHGHHHDDCCFCTIL